MLNYSLVDWPTLIWEDGNADSSHKRLSADVEDKLNELRTFPIAKLIKFFI